MRAFISIAEVTFLRLVYSQVFYCVVLPLLVAGFLSGSLLGGSFWMRVPLVLPFILAWLTNVSFFYSDCYRSSLMHVLPRARSSLQFLLGTIVGNYMFAAVILILSFLSLFQQNILAEGTMQMQHFLLLLAGGLVDLLLLTLLLFIPGMSGHNRFLFVTPFLPVLLAVITQSFLPSGSAFNYIILSLSSLRINADWGAVLASVQIFHHLIYCSALSLLCGAFMSWVFVTEDIERL
jgi:hypothetical protein